MKRIWDKVQDQWVYDGDTCVLTLNGEALDGTAIEGTDCVVIIAKADDE